MGMITSILETEAAKLDLRDLPISPFDKLTVSDFLKQKGAVEDAYTYFETTVKGLLGIDATELSLFFYLDYIQSEGALESSCLKEVMVHNTSDYDKVLFLAIILSFRSNDTSKECNRFLEGWQVIFNPDRSS
jgi:hypothetical protein